MCRCRQLLKLELGTQARCTSVRVDVDVFVGMRKCALYAL
jgi:hypothetical protein